MNKNYYDVVSKLQRNTDPEYIQGWVGGYLGNPEREEQRQTDAYRAGYSDGKLDNTNSAKHWKAR